MSKNQKLSRRDLNRWLLLASATFGYASVSGYSPAWSAQSRSNAKLLSHAEAVAEGERLHIGSAERLMPLQGQPVVAGEYTALKFRYLVGDVPITPGGFIWFTMRHVFHSTLPQNSNPSEDGFVAVEGPPQAKLSVILWPNRNDGEDLFLKAFPWQHVIEIRVDEGELKSGDTITLHYGDTTIGGRGMRVQPTQEPDFAFRIYVSDKPDAPILPLSTDLILPIVGGPADRLSLVAQSSATPGSKIRLLVRAEDRFGNQDVHYNGTVVLRSIEGIELLTYTFTETDRGLVNLQLPTLDREGVIRFSGDDGRLQARSNPVLITNDPKRRIWFGDTHGHTELSDGRGTADSYFSYARDVAGLDFCALTDHDFMLSDESWADLQETVEKFNEDFRFSTIHAFEWSGMTDVGGDHNVYFRANQTALTRCRSYYDYRNQQAYHGETPQTNHIQDLYDFLLSKFPEGQVMVIPHYGGRPANPKWHEPRLERMIEVYSDHQRSREWVGQFTAKNYQLGFLASSDNHTGRPGYGFLHNPLLAANGFEIGTGLAAVFAEDLSRASIFDALFNRHAYATSGDRILLFVKLGDTLMGQAIVSDILPALSIEVEGTASVTAVEVIRNGSVVHTQAGDKDSVAITWQDPNPLPDNAAYWVRVSQSNGEEALSSPIWWSRKTVPS